MKLKDYIEKAKKEKRALGQFNFSNLTALKGIIQAAQSQKSPLILGTSEKASRKIGLAKAVSLARECRRKTGLPIFLNLDHGKSFVYIKKAIDAGYDAVQFDGSGLSLEENIKETKKVVEYAGKFNVFVEGEVGVIGGKMTSPKDASKFVQTTRVGSLAVAIGNVHGINKKGINPLLNLKRLKEIKDKVGQVPLVLHGGSGTAHSDIKKAIKLGVAKVNISTEIKQAKTSAKIQEVVENKIKLFNSANKK